jgi:hypothetical protein
VGDAIVAKSRVEDGHITQVDYLPCISGHNNPPELLKNDKKGHATFNYVEKITNDAGLNAKFSWDGDEVNII